MNCPVCQCPIVGYCCASCGYIPFDPDSTGDTGQEDYKYGHPDSPIGPWPDDAEEE